MSNSQKNQQQLTINENQERWSPESFWKEVMELTKSGKLIQDFIDDDFSDLEEAGFRDAFACTEENIADCAELNRNCKQ